MRPNPLYGMMSAWFPQKTLMIPQPSDLSQLSSWQLALKTLITDPIELLKQLDLSPQEIPWIGDKHFPLRVTPSFVARMRKQDPNDPLLRQVLTAPRIEGSQSYNYSDDPLEEATYNPVPGVLHKYPSRVLLTLTRSCAIHCRYCFRQHFPYHQNTPGRQGWPAIFRYIREHPEIIEVILSGGDPLMLPDPMLQLFCTQLATIPHVRLLRIHSRLPVVLPERICPAFLSLFQELPFQAILVYHTNHPAEIIPALSEGVAHLRAYGIFVLNQTVLLKAVNDSLECLKALSVALFKAGILPYYLHLLDPVKGAEAFQIPLSHAKQLQEGLREALPGYLVPRFVKEIPHTLYKQPLDLL